MLSFPKLNPSCLASTPTDPQDAETLGILFLCLIHSIEFFLFNKGLHFYWLAKTTHFKCSQNKSMSHEPNKSFNYSKELMILKSSHYLYLRLVTSYVITRISKILLLCTMNIFKICFWREKPFWKDFPHCKVRPISLLTPSKAHHSLQPQFLETWFSGKVPLITTKFVKHSELDIKIVALEWVRGIFTSLLGTSWVSTCQIYSWLWFAWLAPHFPKLRNIKTNR